MTAATVVVRPRRAILLRLGLAAIMVGTAAWVLPTPAKRAAAAGPPGACTAPAATQGSGSSFDASETLCRYFADQAQVVDQRNFSLNVSNTSGLHDGQVISVSWSGAHPTGGIVSDQQLAQAAFQEFPVVLMECRGVDSTTAAPAQQLSPATCWTATPDERAAWDSSNNPLWSLDMFNSPANRAVDVNTPPADPTGCGEPGSNAQYWVHFVAQDGKDYPVGPEGCSGSLPPEMENISPAQEPAFPVPSDTTYAQTYPDGTGTAEFTVQTALSNASLGCSDTVACSLVVVPVEGISCNSNPPASAAYSQCESLGTFTPGQPSSAHPNPAPAVEGKYWWSASNWDRRISVPLTFSPAANVCSQANAAPVNIYGSELMAQATQQWDPHFCLDPKLFPVSHIQTPEPAAKNLLQSGAIEAAFEGEPPEIPSGQQSFFYTPTVQAPVAVGGFAISYVIDNSGGRPYTQLRLNPRLLAKLMTESYPGTPNVASGDPGISKNPLATFYDPEFLALNPGYKLPTDPTLPQTAPAATLFSILSQADVLWALTAYINGDPEARAWLDGQPDPWGMVVNPAYKGIQLPVSSWPLLDTSTNGPDYDPNVNPCLAPAPTPPGVKPPALIPDRPLVDNPVGTFGQVAYNLQYSLAVSDVVCNFNQGGNFYNLQTVGPETLGDRFMIGVVSLPAADELGLNAASLQTNVAPDALAKFSDPSGRTFIAPSAQSLQAAATLFQPDTTLGSWQLPYNELSSSSTARGAYPGTMLMSLDVPTQGLPATDAKNLAAYMTFAVTDGQTPGTGVGQLPAGYLPMTAANGLGPEVAFTEAAAAAVAAQKGGTPAIVPGSGSPGSNNTSGTNGSGPATSSLGQPGSGAAIGATSPSTVGGLSSATTGGAPTKHGSSKKTLALFPALAFGAGLGGLALPLALVIALLGGAVAASFWWYGRRRPAK